MFCMVWVACGLMNLGGYANYQGKEKKKSEAIIFFLAGPIVSLIWAGGALMRKYGN